VLFVDLCVLRDLNLYNQRWSQSSQRITKDTKLLQIRDDTMQRVAFKMKLFAGNAEEYKKRHDAIWPELKSLLKTTGINEYSIFFDEETDILFGVLGIEDPTKLDELPGHPVMRKWWNYMKDIMETNEDGSPVSVGLKEVFYLP
jgi:L-rhamnose mutarotase